MKVKYPKPLNSPGAPAIIVADIVAAAISIRARRMEAVTRKARALYALQGMELLCKYYGIDWKGSSDDVFFRLALKLAEDWVPYFNERKQRSKVWDINTQAQLLLDVWAIQARGKKFPRRYPGTTTISGACEALHSKKLPRYKNQMRSSLEQRYKEADRDLSLTYSREQLGDWRWREIIVNLAGASTKKNRQSANR